MKRKVEAIDVILNGKIPPHEIESEISLLANLLTIKNTIDKAKPILTHKDFYDSRHEAIYLSMEVLYSENKPINIVTVMQELKKNKSLELIGGIMFLTSITDKIVYCDVEFTARLIKEKSILRNTIEILTHGITNGFENGIDVFDYVNDLVKDIEKNIDIKKSQIQHISSIGMEVFNKMEENKNSGSELIGLPSCLKKVNEKLLGYSAPDFIILAARPGEGKTTFLVNEFYTIAKAGHPVLLFSMEMKVHQIVMKILSSLAETTVLSIRSGKIEDEEYKQVALHVEKSLNIPFYVVDASGLTTMEIKAITKSAIKDFGIKIVGVDYIQIAKGSSKYGSREQEVSDIAKDLKGLAMECEIPVIALSQMSRFEKGTYRLPQLQDLKESGGLEANADIVMFITRPHYHGVTEVKGYTITFGENDALFIVSKYRLGSIGGELIKFEGKYNRFSDYEKETNYTDYTETSKSNELPF